MKLSEKFIEWIKGKYIKKGIEWQKSDLIIWSFWTNVFPYIAWIPLLFWMMKKIFIDYFLHKKGFEETIIYLAIILLIRFILMQLFEKISELRK